MRNPFLSRYRAAVTVIDDAWRAARRAEVAAGVRIRTLEDPNDQGVAVRIFDEVWPPESGATHVKSNLLRALVHSGGYVAAAFDDSQPVGAALAVVGRHRVGGYRIFRDVRADNDNLYQVVMLQSRETSTFVTHFLDGQTVTLDGSP